MRKASITIDGTEYNLKYLSEYGTYNTSFVLNKKSSPENLLVLKLRHNQSLETNTPERAARLFNEINKPWINKEEANFKARVVAIQLQEINNMLIGLKVFFRQESRYHSLITPFQDLIEKGHERLNCLIRPYIPGTQPSDREMSKYLIQLYNRTGRIIANAPTRDTLIKSGDDIVTVDTDFALKLSGTRERSGSRVSISTWHTKGMCQSFNEPRVKYRDTNYFRYFSHKAAPRDKKPEAVETITALLFFEAYAGRNNRTINYNEITENHVFEDARTYTHCQSKIYEAQIQASKGTTEEEKEQLNMKVENAQSLLDMSAEKFMNTICEKTSEEGDSTQDPEQLTQTQQLPKPPADSETNWEFNWPSASSAFFGNHKPGEKEHTIASKTGTLNM